MYFLGVDLQGEMMELALLQKEKGKIHIEQLLSFDARDIKQFYIFLSSLKVKGLQIVTGLNCHQVFLRFLKLKLKSKRAIFAALPFQLESLLPFKDPIVIPLYRKGAETIPLVCTPSFSISDHLREMPIDPDIISCYPIALKRYAQFYYPNEEKLLVVHIGKEQASCVAIHKGEAHVSHAFNMSEFEKELERFLLFSGRKVGEGGKLLMTGLPHEVSTDLTTVKPVDPLHAVAIGLALDHLVDDQGIQFFEPKKAKRKRKRRRTMFLTACSLLTLMTCLLSFGQIQKRERQLLEKLQPFALNGSLTEQIETLTQSVSSYRPLSLSKMPKTRVSDLVVWLSTHPSMEAGVQLQSLNYTVLKKEARVDLAFKIDSPSIADDVRIALLEFGAVTWEKNKTGYIASFALKEGKR